MDIKPLPVQNRYHALMRRGILISAAVAMLLVIGIATVSYQRSMSTVVRASDAPDGLPNAPHQPVPAEVRGIYVSAYTAASTNAFRTLLASVKEKGINAAVVDIKDYDGSLSFAPLSASLASEAPEKPTIHDLDTVVTTSHELGMYLIARVPVFEDPSFAEHHRGLALQTGGGRLWHDRKGLAWLDAAAVPAWKYNAQVAVEAYRRGFDEIQFDYIRFATDGNTDAIVYPVYDEKRDTFRAVIGHFFEYMDRMLRPKGIPISADLFGLVTWHQTDMGIGQWLADGLAHFDYISPMVYPSHYPSGTLQFANPAEHPYEIVNDSMRKGNEVITELTQDPNARVGKFRPWLQAFDMGATYSPDMVMAQVRAARDNGNSGFLFWNARNVYPNLPNLNNE
jgi:hypothetical protein